MIGALSRDDPELVVPLLPRHTALHAVTRMVVGAPIATMGGRTGGPVGANLSRDQHSCWFTCRNGIRDGKAASSTDSSRSQHSLTRRSCAARTSFAFTQFGISWRAIPCRTIPCRTNNVRRLIRADLSVRSQRSVYAAHLSEGQLSRDGVHGRTALIGSRIRTRHSRNDRSALQSEVLRHLRGVDR